MNQRGFTLIEVMIAIAVLSIGFTALALMQTTATNSAMNGRVITSTASVAADHIETLHSLPYDHEWLLDDKGPGRDGNYFDTDGLRSPLPPLQPHPDAYPAGDPRTDIIDLTQGFEFDHTITTDDGDFTIYWNIAEDYPIDSATTLITALTVKVIVVSSGLGQQRTVTFQTCIPYLQ